MKCLAPIFVCGVLLTTFGLSSCKNDENKANISKSVHKIDLQPEIEGLLKQGDFEANIQFAYQQNQHKPYWFEGNQLSKQGDSVLLFIMHAEWYGLLSQMYASDSIHKLVSSTEKEKWALADVLLSQNFVNFCNHLNHGVLDSNLRATDFVDTANYAYMLIKKASSGDNVSELLSSIQPSWLEYKSLQKALRKFVETHELSTEKHSVLSVKEDSIHAEDNALKALQISGFIDKNSSKTDSSFLLSLQNFQRLNGLSPDGVVGSNTAKALSKSNFERWLSAAVSLDKMRKDWRNNHYLSVNIASFRLQVVNNNQLVEMHHVVVGKYSNKTPELNSKISNVVINPLWSVPYSISSKELLPKIKNDPSYLSRNGYKLYTREHERLNVDSVNWSGVTKENFNYRIQQNSGSGNALGRIKFNFPNKYQVYLHDSPSKSLYKNEVRAYSHGCVRVQYPDQLASYLMSENNEKVYSTDSIQRLIKKGGNKTYKLETEVDVFIRYYTAEADTSGDIRFYQDVYDKDKAYLSAFGKLAEN